MATDVVAANSDFVGVPVDIAPAQGEQLALPKPRHGGGHKEDAVCPAEWPLTHVYCFQKAHQLVEPEGPDVGVRFAPRPIDQFAWVLSTPALPLSEGERLRQQLEGIRSCLGTLAVAQHGLDEGVDFLGRHLADRDIGELRRNVRPEDGAVALEGRRLATNRPEMPKHVLGGYAKRHFGAGGGRLLAHHQPS